MGRWDGSSFEEKTIAYLFAVFDVPITMSIQFDLPGGGKCTTHAFMSLENMRHSWRSRDRKLEFRQNSATWGIRITRAPFRASIMRGPRTGPCQKGTLPVTARSMFGGIESTMAKVPNLLSVKQRGGDTADRRLPDRSNSECIGKGEVMDRPTASRPQLEANPIFPLNWRWNHGWSRVGSPPPGPRGGLLANMTIDDRF